MQVCATCGSHDIVETDGPDPAVVDPSTGQPVPVSVAVAAADGNLVHPDNLAAYNAALPASVAPEPEAPAEEA